MRILQVDVNAKNSSTGNIAYAIHNSLKTLGHQSLLCYGRGPLINEPDILKFADDSETNIHALLTRLTGYTGIYSPKATKRLIQAIEDFKPDIVHLSELHSYFVNPIDIIKYLKDKGIYTLWSFHCDIMYTGKCGTAQDCRKYEQNCGKCPRLREYPKTYIDRTSHMLSQKRKAFENWDRLYLSTPSQWQKQRITLSFLKHKKVSIIKNGVDCNVFKPADNAYGNIRHELGLANNSKIILSVMPSIQDSNKGLSHVFELAKLLSDYTFIIAYKQGQISTALPNNIIFKQGIQGKALAEYYSAADMFFLTSKSESFSLCTAESLACGTPVVGFKCGAPEMLYAEPYARFVSCGDIDAAKKIILEQKAVDKQAIASYARFEFSQEAMVSAYIDCYKQILRDKNNS